MVTPGALRGATVTPTVTRERASLNLTSKGCRLTIVAGLLAMAGTAHAQTPPPPATADHRPVVSLLADSPRAQLQVQTWPNEWNELCAAPCNRPVDPQGVYRIAGRTVLPSPAFRLPRPDGPVTVRVHAGSTIRRKVGLGLTLGGVGGLLVGGTLLAVSRTASSERPELADTDIRTPSNKDVTVFYGVIGVIVGVALLAVGIPLFASHTSVDVE